MPRVELKGMSFEKGMRIFRKKVENAGIKDRIREKEFYVKPSATKNEKNNYTKRKRKKDIEKAKELEFRRKIAMKTKGL
tara:strand:- start:166 stop:402 length:237 start_codon:yes stop_codon:yes gene_type:complete